MLFFSSMEMLLSPSSVMMLLLLMAEKVALDGRFHAVLGVEHGGDLLQRVSRTRVLLDEVDLFVIFRVSLLAQVEDVVLHRQRLGSRHRL